MKKSTTYFVICVLISGLLSSCAFHGTFPFICGSPNCVKNQQKKRRAAIKKVKKKYFKSKSEKSEKNATVDSKSKKQEESNGYSPKKTEYYTYDSAQIAFLLKQQRIDFSACTIKKDSAIILFSANEDMISDAYKDSLLKFIRRLPIEAISCITLKGYSDSTETDTRVVNLAYNRTLSTFYCLSLLGIPPDKMAIINSPVLFRQDPVHNEKITVTPLKRTEINIYW